MPSWTGQTKGVILGYKIFLAFISAFKVTGAYVLLYPVVTFYLFFSNKKYIAFFYRKLFGNNILKIYTSVFKNYIQLGKVFIDRFAILSGKDTDFTFDYNGEEYLHEMANQGKGGIIIGAHLGNWEVAGQLLDRIKRKVNIIVFDGERPEMKEFTDKVMKDRNINFIYIRPNSFYHLEKIDEVLKKGELIAMHGDRSFSEEAMISENFLGDPAMFPTGPFFLANKYKLPVSFIFTLKDKKRHYSFFATKPRKYEYTNNLQKRKELVRIIINDYIYHLEDFVKKYPYQWFNYHKFWINDK
jgi:predicted LPLAT superfamily acyltransferase